MTEVVRKFESGATRDIDTHKIDYAAMLSPLVLRRYGQFMRSHAQLPDGTIRPGDNWKKGISESSYEKSAFRHWMDIYLELEGFESDDPKGFEEAACALLFNISGALHERLKKREYGRREVRLAEES